MYLALLAFIVVDNVYVDGRGPYPFLVDTGAQSTIVDPELAAQAGLQPTFRVELETAAGTIHVPGVTIGEVRFEGRALSNVEVLIRELSQVRMIDRRIRGVLGQSWLSRVNYRVDHKSRRLELDPPEASGIRLPLHYVHGRPAVDLAVDGVSRRMVLDSGASISMCRARLSGPALGFLTQAGSARADTGKAVVRIPGQPNYFQTTFISGPHDLIATRLFSSVYINQKQQYVVLHINTRN